MRRKRENVWEVVTLVQSPTLSVNIHRLTAGGQVSTGC